MSRLCHRNTRRAGLLVGSLVGGVLLAGSAAAQQAIEMADSSAAPGAATSGSAAAGAAASSPGVSGAGAPESGPEINPAPPPPAFTDTVLPSFGLNPYEPNYRSQLLDAFGDTQPPAGGDRIGRDWQILPVLTVAEEWTDNAGVAAGAGIPENGNAGSDFVTLIEPQLTVLGNTERLQVNLHYAPIGEIFAENSGFNQIRENADGDVLATVLPGWLYFDVRGNISQQPVFGGLGLFGSTLLAPNDRETVSSVSASPYVTHTFGGTGTLQAGVAYLYSATDAPGYLNQPGAFVPLATSYNYGSSWLATERAFASFTTGENYQRFQNRIGVDANYYDGSGELRGGRRDFVTDDASYAINRYVAALGEIGFEDTDYPQGGFRYVGVVGAAGVRLTPSRNSLLVAEWRYIDGFGSPYIYGSWQVTPHVRLFGGYSEGIASYDQDQQNQLLGGNIDQGGVAASSLIAAPLLYSNGLFAGNQALNRVRRLDATAVYAGERDTLTASFDWEHSTLIGNPDGLPTSVLNRLGPSNLALATFGLLASNSSTNYTGAADWTHDLRTDLTSNLYAGYNHSRDAAVIDEASSAVLLSAGLTKTFTRTISGSVTYAGTYFVDGVQIGNVNRNNNTVTVSVTKQF